MTHKDETLPLGGSFDAGSPQDVLVVVSRDGGLSRPLPARGEIVIGRDDDCDVVIDDPSISRRHATITCGEALRIRDLGSRNGTKVTGKLLSPDVDVALSHGEVVEIGRVVLVVSRHRGVDEATRAIAASAREASRARTVSPADDHDVVVGGVVERMLDLLARVAQADISVLLLGETGVGKDVFAEIIHRRSPRRAQPFVRIHCAALSDALFESELFGHEQGSFTGATRAKRGLLESAEGGTVFLDEIGELPPATQVKLLKVVEDRRVTRVGAVSAKKIDVRFIAATNRDLTSESGRGSFRADLYFRLSAMTITIPPLRDRRDEIVPMARAFLPSGGGRRLTEDAERALLAHDWPGNVRELKNTMARACVVAGDPDIRAADLGLAASTVIASAPSLSPNLTLAQREEARVIVETLASTAGNQTEAAKRLGISRRTLVSRLTEYGIPRPRG